MTVQVPFQLRRRDVGVPAAATALFVPGRDAAALLALCTRLGLDPRAASTTSPAGSC